MRTVLQLSSENMLSFMRRAGYGFQKESSGEVAFVRRVGQSPFPRFHVYAQQDNARLTVNLHIDQKQPTYGSGYAHSGEYDGPAIAAECQRLRALAAETQPTPQKPLEEKKGFWEKLFG